MRTAFRGTAALALVVGCSAPDEKTLGPEPALVRANSGRTWTPVDLGSDPTYSGNVPEAIARSGRIAGYGYRPGLPPVPSVTRETGTWHYLTPLVGDSGATATGVNSAGLVAGVSQTTTFGPFRPVYWRDGGVAQQVPGITSGQAHGVSETGWIVGESYAPQFRGFRYRPGGAVEFLQPGTSYPFTQAFAVNDLGWAAGQVAGPMIWSPDGTPTPIRMPEAYTDGAARAINRRGDVAGFIGNDAVSSRAFVRYRNRPLQLLQLPAGTSISYAHSIDARGAVYGWAAAGTPGSPLMDFIWVNGVPQPVPQVPGLQAFVYGVNQCGIMVGAAWDGQGYRAIRWDTAC
ncbi:MAG: hypothetical protein ACKVZ0_08540 [Gemmatimonadales bacterium]